jgi:hypothetical protein
LRKTESPHVLEFLGETLENLNVRDDILASDKNDAKPPDQNDVRNDNDDDDDEKEFYDFLSTGRHVETTRKDADDFDLTSEEEEQLFYDFLSTGKHRKIDLNDDSSENEVTSNDVFETSSEKRRFKRRINDDSSFGKIDDYFAQKDSLFGGSSWDGHYIGDIW